MLEGGIISTSNFSLQTLLSHQQLQLFIKLESSSWRPSHSMSAPAFQKMKQKGGNRIKEQCLTQLQPDFLLDLRRICWCTRTAVFFSNITQMHQVGSGSDLGNIIWGILKQPDYGRRRKRGCSAWWCLSSQITTMHDGARLSWRRLNTCSAMGSGEWISCFALLLHMTFALPMEQFLSLIHKFPLLSLFWFSPPSHWREVSSCVWLGLNHNIGVGEDKGGAGVFFVEVF